MIIVIIFADINIYIFKKNIHDKILLDICKVKDYNKERGINYD